MKSLFCLLLFAFAFGCEKSDFQTVEDSQSLTSHTSHTLVSARQLPDGLTLPLGTVINVVENGFNFILPTGYVTVFEKETEDGESLILGPGSGGYSCTCSGSGACTVVYDSGTSTYGCGHGTCERNETCTGAYDKSKYSANSRLVGIVYSAKKSDGVLPGNPTKNASWVAGYEFDPFELAEFKLAIQELYDFAFENNKEIDMSDYAFGEIPEGYGIVQVNYLGHAFGMLLPTSGNQLDELVPDSEYKSADPGNGNDEYTCTGSNGCECTGNRKCILGRCIYTCTGCTTCTLSVDE
jgi:hypothetical protein